MGLSELVCWKQLPVVAENAAVRLNQNKFWPVKQKQQAIVIVIIATYVTIMCLMNQDN